MKFLFKTGDFQIACVNFPECHFFVKNKTQVVKNGSFSSGFALRNFENFQGYPP